MVNPRSWPPSRRRLAAVVTALAVVTAFLHGMVASPAGAAPAAAAAAAERFGGTELLAAVFFGTGEAGRAYPHLALNPSIAELDGAEAAADRLIGEVITADSSLPDRFAAALYSGDRMRIQTTVTEAADLLNAATGYTTQAVPDPGSLLAIAVVVAVVAAAVYLYLWLWSASAQDVTLDVGDGGLRVEQWVETVARTLGS